MYQLLLVSHSIVRWLVVLSLLYAIYRAYKGYRTKSPFSKTDNATRHWTATIAHIQLLVGMVLYFKSPIVQFFWKDFKTNVKHIDSTFFGILHIALMLIAITLITIGSALAKRQPTDSEKFRTMLVWFSVGFVVIFIAIPWPFSPLASRPYFR